MPRDLNKLRIIHRLATKQDWEFLDWQESIGMVSYTRAGVRINIYHTTMTVATAMNHPKKGKTQMFRKNVSVTLLRKIFNNPRIHTNKGYQKKNG